MKPIAELFEDDYIVLNINYPSTKHDIESLTDLIYYKHLSDINQEVRVSFVGYSMGGLLVRAILNKYKFKNLHRVLFLATPHQGSEVADFLRDNYLYKKLYGPAGAQLGTKYDKTKIVGEPYYEFAVMAGNSSIDPISSYIIPGDDDGKVSINSAILNNAKDAVVIDASHLFFPSNIKVKKQVLSYIKNGKFFHD